MAEHDYVNMDKAEKQARAVVHYKTFDNDGKHRKAGDYRPENYKNNTTLHEIRIDDKEVKPSLAKTIDQLVSLSKSTLWSDVVGDIAKHMKEYFNLSDEEQVRTYPELLKLYTQIGRDLRDLQETQQNWTNKTPQPAMLINDPNDKRATVIDTDYFKDIESDVKIDFPYQSIAEIMKAKNLSTNEKIAMCDRYLEVKDGLHNNLDAEDGQVVNQSEPNAYDFEVAEIDEMPMDGVMLLADRFDDDEEEEAGLDGSVPHLPKTKKTPKEMFLTLCEKFPKKFSTTKKSGHVGWKSKYRGLTYIPTLITVDPKESTDYEHKCLIDPTIKHLPRSYFVKELNTHVYFVRTTKE